MHRRWARRWRRWRGFDLGGSEEKYEDGPGVEEDVEGDAVPEGAGPPVEEGEGAGEGEEGEQCGGVKVE